MQGLLIDLDGTVFVDDEVLPGAAETIAWLHDQHVPHLFVTNTSGRPRTALVDKMTRHGLAIEAARILTPPVVAARWLRSHAPGPAALFVPEATKVEFSGIPVIPDDAQEGASSVVIGHLWRAWDYEKLNRAFRFLMSEPKPALVALGMTRYARMKDGLDLIVAPFVVALEHAADCSAVVLGKPAKVFFETAAELLDRPVSSLAMVGDDIVTDVGGSQAAGLKGVLVRTGKFRPADLEKGIRPDAVLGSLADLPQWWDTVRSG